MRTMKTMNFFRRTKITESNFEIHNLTGKKVRFAIKEHDNSGYFTLKGYGIYDRENDSYVSINNYGQTVDGCEILLPNTHRREAAAAIIANGILPGYKLVRVE